jgi:uncharacterized protein YggU (UPF0235/DUF167 family)
MSVELRQESGGVKFGVKVHAGGRANAVRGVHDGILKVSVTQAPEKGKANAAVTAVLCDVLNLRRSQLSLISGATDSHKQFLAVDIAIDELRKRINALLGDD